jgi:hypothetical protein
MLLKGVQILCHVLVMTTSYAANRPPVPSFQPATYSGITGNGVYQAVWDAGLPLWGIPCLRLIMV